jgi:hypothetical protein
VIVDVIRYLAEEDALRHKYAIGFLNERREQVGEVVPVLTGRLQYQPEAAIEILLAVPSLVRYVRRIVDNCVEALIPEGHQEVVPDHSWPEAWVDIEAYWFALAADPEATHVHCRV